MRILLKMDSRTASYKEEEKLAFQLTKQKDLKCLLFSYLVEEEFVKINQKEISLFMLCCRKIIRSNLFDRNFIELLPYEIKNIFI